MTEPRDQVQVPPQPTIQHGGPSSAVSGSSTSGQAGHTIGQIVLPPIQHGTFVRMLRLLLRRVLYRLSMLGQAARPYGAWLLVIVALMGVILAQAFFLTIPTIARAISGDERVTALPPSSAVQMFLEAQASYDADLMWESFSPSFQEVLLANGADKAAIAARVESERLAGWRYRNADYIGGIQLDNRTRRFYYVIDIETPQPQESGRYSFIFTVDENDKITRVERP